MRKTRGQDRFDKEHAAGCLLGGAVGDALGAPVEFMRLAEIRRRYGAAGISDPPLVNGISPITDDTQMTLFTAEGVLRAISRQHNRGICHGPTVIYHAYLRWLHTQGSPLPTNLQLSQEHILNGWLIGCKPLFSRRAPGNTCLASLESGTMGTIAEPINDSKGCGGVMRVAPIGLCRGASAPFRLASDAAAITHGHPSGYLAAGVFAQAIRLIMEGSDIPTAVRQAASEQDAFQGHEETATAVAKAIALAKSASPSAEAVESLGGGWVAEESLAIAVYCALIHPTDFPAAIRLAANHSGDSDSTAAMTGNLVGAFLGRDAIPAPWLQHLELRQEMEDLAADIIVGHRDSDAWRKRYPPN